MAFIPEEPAHVVPPAPVGMDPAQKALRDTFVAEYLIDYNQVAAAMRCGFSRLHAVEWAQKFMEEPYVQQKLKATELTLLDPEKETEFNTQRIKQQLMREAHYRGPGSSHAARVAALGKLMSVYGMEKPKKVEADVLHRGGVMRIPAPPDSLDKWEAAAVASQEALQNGQGTS